MSIADCKKPSQALEVDVQGETASAISMAFDSNWSLQYLEEQIKEHKGDVNAIFHEVSSLCMQLPILLSVALAKVAASVLWSLLPVVTCTVLQLCPASSKTALLLQFVVLPEWHAP